MTSRLLNGRAPCDPLPVLHDPNSVFPVFVGNSAGTAMSIPYASRAEVRTVAMGLVDVTARTWAEQAYAHIARRFGSRTGSTVYVRAPVHALPMGATGAGHDPPDIMGLGQIDGIVLVVYSERLLLGAPRFVQTPPSVSDLLASFLVSHPSPQQLSRWDLRTRVNAEIDRYRESFLRLAEVSVTPPANGRAS